MPGRGVRFLLTGLACRLGFYVYVYSYYWYFGLLDWGHELKVVREV
jgi:hypothetical protein